MNKNELLAALSDETGFTTGNCDQFLKAFIKIVMNEVRSGKKVQIVGFGFFSSKVYKGKEARNPKNGKAVQVEDRVKPYFKAGRTFKAYIERK